MTQLHFLADLLIVFLVSGVVVYLGRPLKLPPLVGLLVAGALVGPHGLSLVTDNHDVEILAEIGVVVLLFTVGIEFSLERLLRMWRVLLGAGGGQVLLTIGGTALALSGVASSWSEALFFGFLVALSSTAIVLRLLGDRAELDAPHGGVALGVLLFQDLCVVPLVLLTPFLAGEGGGGAALAKTLLLAAAVVTGVLFAARRVIPGVLRTVVGARSRELFLILLVVLCMGTAWLTSLVGLSLALGAFLAGLAMSESEYGHQAMAEVLPFRDTFGVLFFVSIGMLLDVRFVLDNLPLALGATAAVIAIKTLAGGLPALLMGYPLRVALWVGIGLAQIGEFAFVLAQVGMRSELLSELQYQVFLSASVLSMLLTPALFRLADAAAQRSSGTSLVPWAVEQVPVDPEHAPVLHDHAVLVGYGVNGKNVARALDDAHIPYVVLELNPDTVREARKAGKHIVFGDSTRQPVLEHVGIARARVLVVAISDASATRRTVAIARADNPRLRVIVRTRVVAEVEQLRRLGADEVIPEEFETSVEIFARVLKHFSVPRNVIFDLIARIRADAYDVLRHPAATEEGPRVQLPGVEVETLEMAERCHGAGRSLEELDLRRRTGASVISVQRAAGPIGNPGADLRLEAGDLVVLMGDHAALDRAIAYLLDGPQEPTTTPEPLAQRE